VNELWQSNPDQARRVSDTLASKQADFQNIVAQVGEQEYALSEAQQSEIARRGEVGEAELNRYAKDFTTNVAAEVVKYAIEDGKFSPEEAAKWRQNPVVTKWAHKAMLYDRMQAKAKKPSSKPTQAKPVPAMRAKGAGTGSRDPDNMSMSQLKKHLSLAD
jgi:hypothetical protein